MRGALSEAAPAAALAAVPGPAGDPGSDPSAAGDGAGEILDGVPAGGGASARTLALTPAVASAGATKRQTPCNTPPGTPTRSGAARRTGAKIYARRRAGGTYWYGDFRAHAAVGGRLEPLTPAGARTATQDYREAVRLYAARDAAYLAARESGRAALAAPPPLPRLGPYLAEHLVWKATLPHVRDGTLDRDESSAKVLLRVLGNVPLPEVTPDRLDAYVARRLAEPGARRGTTTSARSVRAELHLLSQAMRRAVRLGHLAANPVSLMMGKPPVPEDEAAFLTDPEAARLLAAAAEEDRETAARLAERPDAGAACRASAGGASGAPGARGPRADGRPPVSSDDQVTYTYAVVAAHLYTGGRAEEVLGLTVGDVDFARGRVHLRHNRWRRLKRERHQRAVTLWPALREVLAAHVAALGLDRPGTPDDALLFPSPVTGRMLYRFGKPLARCLARADLTGAPAAKRVTPHTLRHTFATALLQTLVPTADGGWAVRSSFDVAKQLGHRTSKLVDDTYGHAVLDPVYRRELRYGAGTEHAGTARAGTPRQSDVPSGAANDNGDVGSGGRGHPPDASAGAPAEDQ